MNERASPLESRARHACEPCRRKKTKCPGEKPACSFCRRLNQRCTYSRKDEPCRDLKSKRDSKERLQRLESQMERMNDVLQTLTERGNPDPSLSDARASQGQPEVTDTPREIANETTEASVPCFNASEYPHPPPEVLLHFVKVYKARLHAQPLSIFDVDTLDAQAANFPPFLLRSFLAITMLFSDHAFFGVAKEEAIDFYVRSARGTALYLATEGNSSVEILQSLCLLTLSDLAAGRRSRMWMNIGIASRLVLTCQNHLRSTVGTTTTTTTTTTTEERARCLWSVFVLERAFISGPTLLQSDTPPLANLSYPPSPARPPTVIDLGASNVPYSAASSAPTELGVNAYCLQLISLWGDVVAYSRRLRLGQGEDPWLVSSSYHILVAKYRQFEAGLAQMHRLKNVGFQDISPHDFSQNRYYWTVWIQHQVCFHAGHALLHHPIFYITNSRKFSTKYPPPSFLQQTVDQALLHSGWIVRLLRTWDLLGFELNDPLLGHFLVISATIHWIFQFASDEDVADRARSDFADCQRLLIAINRKWPQFSSVVSGLEFIQTLARQAHETTGNRGIPSLKQSLLWDLLDSDLPSSDFDPSTYLVAPSGQRVETQHLAPLHEPSSMPDGGYSNDYLGSAEYQALQSPIFFPTSILNNDLFSDIDLSIFSRVEGQSSLNLHGGL